MFNQKLKKMKKLENYGVLEMNLREMREVDGGLMIMGALAIALAVAYLAGTVAAAYQGYNAHTRQPL
jgi:hypothetical protein